MKRLAALWFALWAGAALAQSLGGMAGVGGASPSPPTVGGAVALSAVGTKTYTGSAGITVGYTGVTVNSGDTTLVGWITFDLSSGVGSSSAVTAVWDVAGANQSMTLGINGTDVGSLGAATWIFCLQSPASGNKTLTFSWTGSAPTFTDAVSFTGSSTGCQNGAKSETATTVSVTSASGHVVVGASESGTALGTLTSAPNTCPTSAPTCIVYSDSSSGSQINAAAQIAAGSATVAIGSSMYLHENYYLFIALILSGGVVVCWRAWWPQYKF